MFLVDFQLMEEAVAFPHEAATAASRRTVLKMNSFSIRTRGFVSKIAASERRTEPEPEPDVRRAESRPSTAAATRRW